MIEYIQETKTIGRRLCDSCGKEVVYCPQCSICGGDFCAQPTCSVNGMFFPSMSSDDRVCTTCLALGSQYVPQLESLDKQKDFVMDAWCSAGKAAQSAKK